MLLSVVMACHDAEPHLGEQLQALAGQDVEDPWELVVADNGSTDGSLALVETFRGRFPDLRVVDASARPGPAAARNIGVEGSRGERIVFCDADDVVAPGWLAAMSRALQDHAVVAATMEHERLNEPWSLTFRNLTAGLLDSDPPFLPYAFSAVLGVRRQAHESVGGFDESFRWGCEDRDYCYRLQLSGHDLAVAPGAVVHYRHRSSPGAVYRQTRGYGYGNVQVYARYRARGLVRPSQRQALLSWLATPVKVLPALRDRRSLAVFMARTGWRVGRLQGSLRHRVWAL